MNEHSKPPRRRWWQFSLKAILYLTLLVAAYLAGRSHQSTESQRKTHAIRLKAKLAKVAAERATVEAESARLEAENLKLAAKLAEAQALKMKREAELTKLQAQE